MKKAESIEQTKHILSHLIDRIEVGDSKITLYLKLSVPQTEEEAKEIPIEPFANNSWKAVANIDGILEIIPAMIIKEIPLPIPFAVI